VDLTNPQTWNRYAYVGNQPLSNVDPQGLHVVDCSWDGCGFRGGGGGGGVVLDGVERTIFNDSGLGSNAVAPCPNGFCFGPAQITGGKYKGDIAFVQYSADANGNGAYNLLTSPIPDPASPINQINAAYQLGCRYSASPCGSNDSVTVRYVGATYNVTLNGNPLNQATAAADGYKDPLGLFHNGDPSYYIGFGGLFSINEGHVVDATKTYGGLEAHYDSWGPYNPLHWMFEALPSLFINTRGQAGTGTPYRCSVAGGCHP
jgi:hypothetical protein